MYGLSGKTSSTTTLVISDLFSRLLEYARTYFDLKAFPDGETKRALTRAANKRAGKLSRIDDKKDGSDERSKKKRKKD